MGTREITAQYRMAHWAETFQERVNTGEKVKEFCLRKGVSKDTYYYWQQKLRKIAGDHLAKLESKPTGLALSGFTEVKITEPPTSPSVIGADQICIETGLCKVTAGSGYPTEALVVVLREIVKV